MGCSEKFCYKFPHVGSELVACWIVNTGFILHIHTEKHIIGESNSFLFSCCTCEMRHLILLVLCFFIRSKAYDEGDDM